MSAFRLQNSLLQGNGRIVGASSQFLVPRHSLCPLGFSIARHPAHHPLLPGRSPGEPLLSIHRTADH